MILMKKTTAIALANLASAMVYYVGACAAEPASEAGKWEMQPAKSQFCNPAAAPQKSERDIFDAGGGVLLIHWVGVDSKGKPVDIRYVVRYDGKKYAFPSDVREPLAYISWQRISPSKVAFVDWSLDGKMLAVNTRTISSDGKTMIQTTTARDADGKKASCTDRQIFERQ
jgi:hypothetical protein